MPLEGSAFFEKILMRCTWEKISPHGRMVKNDFVFHAPLLVSLPENIQLVSTATSKQKKLGKHESYSEIE